LRICKLTNILFIPTRVLSGSRECAK